MDYTDDEIEDLFRGIWKGEITQRTLSESLYYAIGDHLKKGVFEGFGGTMADFEVGGKDFELLEELRTNIYAFSGAKTYQQTREMVDLLMDGDNVKSFNDFREDAVKVYNQYNQTWLQTEYETAIGQAQSASRWNEIEKNKEVLPLLKYSAVIDPNTSDICKPLDGIIAAVDDKIWSKCSPLNHFRCRCTLEQLDKYTDEKPMGRHELDKVEKDITGEMQDMFKGNPGKDRVIFNDSHPYFTVDKKDKEFAKENFGLPIPEEKTKND